MKKIRKTASLLLILLFTNQLFAQLSFKSEKKEIIWGDSIKLSWKVEKIKKLKSIRIKNIKKNLANEGNIKILPDTTRNYKLEVFTNRRKKKKYRKTIYITLIYPQIEKFETTHNQNTDEDSTTIIWEVKNAKYIVINDTIKINSLKGRMNFLIDSTKTLNIKAYNKNGLYIEKKHKVKIENIEFLKGKSTIYLGDTLRLKWQFKYCKYVQMENRQKKYNPIDSMLLIPKTDTLYNFFIHKENGDTLGKLFSVKINSPVIKFNVPKYTYNGRSAFMQWEVKKGFSVKITGTDKIITKQKGYIKIPLDTKKKYSLSVKNKNGDEIFKQTKRIVYIKSPIRQFRVPRIAIIGTPTKIYWDIVRGYDIRIEGLKNNLKDKGEIEIIPVENKKYTLIISYKGKEVVRNEQFMKVIKRRSYVKQVKNFSELDKNAELNFEIFSIDESNYPNEVKLYVLAVDKQGNFIKGLEQANKQRQKKIIKKLIEKTGNKNRKINDYEFKEYQDAVSLPYDISMALDYSGSMYGTINRLEQAVHTFIRSKNKNDRIAIGRFDDELVKVRNLEANKDSLLKYFTIKGLDTLGGGTALYAGSDYAMNFTKKSNNNKVLLLFTDGMENSSMQYFGKYAHSATELAKRARKNNVTIHVIAYQEGVNNRILQQLAYTTRGNFYKLNFPSDIKAVFKELPIIFRNYYVISYKPSQKKGKHSIRMVYDNLQNKNITIQSDYHVGENISIDENNPDDKKTYWMIAADSLNKTPVSVPQAVAYFDFNEDELLDKYKKSINTYIEYLKTMENASVIIFGHTDSKGTDKYCYELSERRAKAIKEYMLENGIKEEKINIMSCGKDEMIWYPENKDWKARENRRIEILLLN